MAQFEYKDACSIMVTNEIKNEGGERETHTQPISCSAARPMRVDAMKYLVTSSENDFSCER
jgi:hypothetical protein